MKTARWFGILYLSFLLWLLLFPPWMELSGRFIERNTGGLVHPYTSLGHHWRFSVPLHWQWRADARQSFLVPNLAARIDYQRLIYEAVIGLVALALLFLPHSAFEMPIRKIKNLQRDGAKRNSIPAGGVSVTERGATVQISNDRKRLLTREAWIACSIFGLLIGISNAYVSRATGPGEFIPFVIGGFTGGLILFAGIWAIALLVFRSISSGLSRRRRPIA